MKNLFVDGEFTSHAGLKLPFKIDCDALSEDDIKTIAAEIARHVGQFNTVYGVPRGGLRLANALMNHATHRQRDPVLIVDDVLTTGTSMKEARAMLGWWDAIGAVIFARGPCPSWIKPIFTAGLAPADNVQCGSVGGG